MNEKKILAIILIILGSFLEIYYYYFRFINDGTFWIISIIIGLSLNILLMYLAAKKKFIAMTCLIVYSVLCTSAGQTFSLIEKERIEIEKTVNPQIEYLMEENINLQNEKDSINKQIKETIKSLKDRAIWRTALKTAEERKTEIEKQININKSKIEELNGTEVKIRKSKNIYTFYEDLTRGIIKADFLKFILHTVLSIFIAYMAPLGIIEFNREATREKKIDNKTWVEIMWKGESIGKKRIPKENIIITYCQKKGLLYNPEEHQKRFRFSLENGLISQTGMLIKSKTEALQAIKILNI